MCARASTRHFTTQKFPTSATRYRRAVLREFPHIFPWLVFELHGERRSCTVNFYRHTYTHTLSHNNTQFDLMYPLFFKKLLLLVFSAVAFHVPYLCRYVEFNDSLLLWLSLSWPLIKIVTYTVD